MEFYINELAKNYESQVSKFFLSSQSSYFYIVNNENLITRYSIISKKCIEKDISILHPSEVVYISGTSDENYVITTAKDFAIRLFNKFLEFECIIADSKHVINCIQIIDDKYLIYPAVDSQNINITNIFKKD